jgi:hemerythrin
MYIQWKKELESRNDAIDAQHRMMVLLCRKLEIAIRSKERERTVRRVIMELRKFTDFHFTSEENMMHEIGYPELESHARAHSILLLRFDIGMENVSHHLDFPDEITHLLNDCFLKHFLTADLAVAEYIRNFDKHPIGEHLYREFLPRNQAHDPVFAK